MRKTAFIAMLALLALVGGLRASSARTNAQAGTDLLELLPDGSIVAVIDVQRITSSSLWATLSTQPKAKSMLDKMQSDISDIGVSLSDIQTVALVFPGKDLSGPTIAVTGRFDQTSLLNHLRSNQKIKLTSEKYKSYDVYKSETVPPPTSGDAAKAAAPAPQHKPDETSFFFYDSKTVVVGSAASVRASVDTKSGLRPSIAQNAKLTEAIAENASAAIRFAINVTPSMASGLSSSQLPIPDFSSVNLIFGAIDVASGVDLTATLRNDTADHAKSVAERLNGLITMVKGYLTAMSDPKISAALDGLKSVSIVGNDIDVKITASLPLELFAQILK